MNKESFVFCIGIISSILSISCSNHVHADDLSTLFVKAKKFSPHLPLALSQQEIVKQKINQAKAANEPKINFTAQEKKGISARDAGKEIDYRLRNYAIQMSFPIINMSIQEEISSAQISEKVALVQYQATHDELLLNIVDQYFKILNLDSKYQLMQQQKKLIYEQKRMAAANFDQGMVSITDLKEAEAKLATLQSQEQSLYLEISREKNILSQFIGTGDFTIQQIQNSLAVLPILSISDQDFFSQLLLKNNKQIQISELNLEATKIELKQAKAARYPNLNFSAKLSRNFESQDTAFSNKQDGWDYLYGFELNVPMYNSETHFKIKEKQASLDKSKNELNLAIQKQQSQMLESFYTTLSSMSKANGMKEAESSLMVAWQSNKRAYEVGMRVNADVLEAQSKYFEIKQERISAWYEAWQNYIKCKIILGTFTDADLVNIDQIFYAQS
ncbi:TolC family protein [Acinetobacter bouvetii]|uniref:Outer membrane protein TolC n=1 Tax=Acinetobacter bouvetii TaxID=202951 RepID=A0A811GCG0_9GAMM|nr:TolC family protein [Acinetobacter bouvetii]CAB1216216.1 Outer membrane protein TolC [Acinetobacter bouvetii]